MTSSSHVLSTNKPDSDEFGILILSSEYDIVGASAGAAEILKLLPDNVIGKNLLSFVEKRHRARIIPVLRSKARGVFRLPIVASDRQIVTVSAAFAQIFGRRIGKATSVALLSRFRGEQLTNGRDSGSARILDLEAAVRSLSRLVSQSKYQADIELRDTIDKVLGPALQNLSNRVSDDLHPLVDLVRNTLLHFRDRTEEFGSVLMNKLTARETTICQMIRSGMSTKQIASAFMLSEHTVLTHRKTIRRKLGISGDAITLEEYLNKSNPE